MASNPNHPLSHWRRIGLATILLTGTALGGFAAGHSVMAETTGGVITPSAPAQMMPDFANLVSEVQPAVVSITSKMPPEANDSSSDDQSDASPQMPFGQMPGMPFGQMHPARPHIVEARGSGFIIDANGTVVTNNHVVRGAKSVTVTLTDGTELPAKVLGRDPRTDLAVLKIDAGHTLPFIQLGDSSGVRPGQWVLAVGNPFGLGGTVTAGIVSAKGRDIGEGPYDQFLQIDAPINQGNSGGPLFTQDGKVVGVNTAILSPTGGSIGIGFAIPSNVVKTVVAQLETGGHVARGYLGVSAQPVGAELSKALALPDTTGALVASIQTDSPAARAGIQPGDVIASVDGHKVTDPHDLALDIANVKPGEKATLDLIRDGHQQTLNVTLAELSNDPSATDAGNAAASGEADHQRLVGIALAPLNAEARAQLELPKDVHGALVAQVKPGSPAETAGLQPGDVVIGVGTAAVSSPEEALRAIRSATKGKEPMLALRIIHQGQTAFVAIPMQAEQPSEG